MRFSLIKLFEAINAEPVHSPATDQYYWHAFSAELFECRFAFNALLHIVLGVRNAFFGEISLRFFAHATPARRIHDNLFRPNIDARRIVRYPFVGVYPERHLFRRVRPRWLIGEVNLAVFIDPAIDLRMRGIRQCYTHEEQQENR